MSSPTKDQTLETSSSNQPEHKSISTTSTPSTSVVQDVPVDDAVQGIEDFEAPDQESLYGNDSALGFENSETTSIASSIYAGYVEHGRRYQTLREGEYWGPSDEKQFEAMETAHTLFRILDYKQPNQLFHSPLPDKAQHILDIGTGSGIWAREVADKFPQTVVTGVDLYPPPETWIPPNCKLEVDDVLKPWTWSHKFDLIHLRMMMGAFTDEQWRLVYKQTFNNLQPGGYIEHLEGTVSHCCDDGTMPSCSDLAKWGPLFIRAGEKTGKKLDTAHTMRARIEAAGFINIREKTYKIPVGEWARNPMLREAGRFNKAQLLEGMEGYAMYLLTKFGEPEPWTPDEVQVFLAKIRKDLSAGYHTYFITKRVWGQKPLDSAELAKSTVEVENVGQ